MSHFETCKECRLDSWPENGFDFGIPRDGADGVGDDLEADFLVFGAAVEYVFCLVVLWCSWCTWCLELRWRG